jgi:hypothetical protein
MNTTQTTPHAITFSAEVRAKALRHMIENLIERTSDFDEDDEIDSGFIDDFGMYRRVLKRGLAVLDSEAIVDTAIANQVEVRVVLVNCNDQLAYQRFFGADSVPAKASPLHWMADHPEGETVHAYIIEFAGNQLVDALQLGGNHWRAIEQSLENLDEVLIDVAAGKVKFSDAMDKLHSCLI